MKKSEVSRFQKILEARVIELSHSASRRDGIVIEKSAEPLESLTGAAERELAVRTLEFDSAKLRETRAALRRIQDGTFGACQECGEDLGPRRLAAVPWAALCIVCQEASDCHCGANHVRPKYALAA
jgi:RNA polymerase-binding transcription factor